MPPQPERIPPLLIDDDDSLSPPRGAWLFLLSIVFAKISLITVVFVWDFSPLSTLYVVLTSWTWIIIGVVLLFGPASLAIRLRKVRSRRHALVRSEWMLDE
jgi:hypothetical protein